MKLTQFAAITALTLASAPAIALVADEARSLASINGSAWVFYGNNHTHQKVSDSTIPGKAALRIVIPNDGGAASGATGQSPIKSAIKEGETVKVTVWLKGVTTASGTPAKAIIKLKDAAKPYGNYAEQTFDLANDWKPYSIDYLPQHDFPAGSLNMVVQLALGRQTVDVGPAKAEIVSPTK